jgi:hypothetical protein
VDFFAASRAAECAGIYITAIGRAGTFALRNPISSRGDRHANRKTHQFRARDTNGNSEARRDTNADTDTETNGDTVARGNTHAGSNTNTDGNPNTNSDATADSSTDTNSDGHPDANSHAPHVQPRLRDRDGERGVAQHYW